MVAFIFFFTATLLAVATTAAFSSPTYASAFVFPKFPLPKLSMEAFIRITSIPDEFGLPELLVGGDVKLRDVEDGGPVTLKQENDRQAKSSVIALVKSTTMYNKRSRLYNKRSTNVPYFSDWEKSLYLQGNVSPLQCDFHSQQVYSVALQGLEILKEYSLDDSTTVIHTIPIKAIEASPLVIKKSARA
ncbi:hypothetical protein L2E82_47194 [Cichorium intybus]|uniref:Uncharacterized protein n=1 Tax=Cichorium intybus TaxID=13427 RepID=A0ACB8YUW4_CICIN|nr:hypothetical protein L2E82_47194 [Cichorium intybus]